MTVVSGSEAVGGPILSRREDACCLRCGAARGLSAKSGCSHRSPEERVQHRPKAGEAAAAVEEEVEAVEKMKARDARSCAAVSPIFDEELAYSERPWLVVVVPL